MRFVRWVFCAACVLAVGACSSVPYAQRQAQLLAEYTAAAGAPVQSFRFLLSLYSWVPLSNTELAVYTRPNKAWLLDVDGGCPALTYTQSIGITSYLNQVTTNFDKVLTGRHDFPCTITRIRPLDITQLKAAQKARRQIHTEPRPTQGAKSSEDTGSPG